MTDSTYSLNAGDTIGKAWDKVYGFKGSIWAAIVITFLVMFCVGFICGLLANVSSILTLIVNITGQVASGLLQIGFIYMGILRAKDMPVSYKDVFHAFEMPIFLKVVGVYVIQFAIYIPITLIFIALPLIIVGPNAKEIVQSGFSMGSLLLVAWFLLGVIASVYVALRMWISLGYVLDQNMSAWNAVKMSFNATADNMCALMVIILVQIASVICGALLLGIGLIWAIPFAAIIFGVTYKNLAYGATGAAK